MLKCPLVRPWVLEADVEAGYRKGTRDEARETEAHQWAEAVTEGAYDATRWSLVGQFQTCRGR